MYIILDTTAQQIEMWLEGLLWDIRSQAINRSTKKQLDNGPVLAGFNAVMDGLTAGQRRGLILMIACDNGGLQRPKWR